MQTPSASQGSCSLVVVVVAMVVVVVILNFLFSLFFSLLL
jgi:hypothetical protein